MLEIIKKPTYPNLEAALSRIGYNYRMLADALGVSKSFITRRMKGEVAWEVKLAIKIAKMLGGTVEFLFETE